MMDFFELFDIPVSLLVDTKEITKKYYSLCKKYHPDQFSLDDAEKQDMALDMTSKINRAKKVLSHPHKRLDYILKEKGIVETEEKYQLPPMFLGEMMDINEALMELEFDPNPNAKERIGAQVAEQSSKLFDEVKSFFEKETLELNDEDASLLKDYYYKKKYLDRIQEKL